MCRFITHGGIVILLLSLMCERVVFTLTNGVFGNHFDYYSKKCLKNLTVDSNANASTSFEHVEFKDYFSVHYGYLFNFVSFISPIFGGILGDVFGRYWTMIVGSLVYIIGSIIFEIMLKDLCQVVYHYACVYCLSLAVSLMLTNIIILGAQQAKQIKINNSTFFLLVYGAWSLGHAIGNFVLWSHHVYRLGCISILLSLLWSFANFIYFYRYEKDKPDHGLMFSTLKSLVSLPSKRFVNNTSVETSCFNNYNNEPCVAIENCPTNRPSNCQAKKVLSFQLSMNEKPMSWQWLTNMLPLYAMFGLYIVALIDNSYDYPAQYTEILNISQKNDGWDLMHSNAEVMSIYFSSMAMTVVLLLMVLQCTSRFYCFQQLLQPPLRRVGLALIFIFVALIISITHTKNSDGSQIVSYKSLIPQIFLSGSSEALGCAAGFEIAYVLSPKQLRSLALGLLKTIWGLGFLTSLILQYQFAEILQWRPSLKMTQGLSNFQMVYCILATLVVVSSIILLLLVVFMEEKYVKIFSIKKWKRSDSPGIYTSL